MLFRSFLQDSSGTQFYTLYNQIGLIIWPNSTLTSWEGADFARGDEVLRDDGYLPITTSAGTTTLTSRQKYVQTNGTQSHTFLVPAPQLVGEKIRFINRSTQTIIIKDATNTTVLATVPTGWILYFKYAGGGVYAAHSYPMMNNGVFSFNNLRLTNVADPTSLQDAATKAYSMGNGGAVTSAGAGATTTFRRQLRLP